MADASIDDGNFIYYRSIPTNDLTIGTRSGIFAPDMFSRIVDTNTTYSTTTRHSGVVGFWVATGQAD